VLNAVSTAEITNLLLKSFISSLGCAGDDFSRNLLGKLHSKLYISNKIRSLTKYKNYCLLSGRGRTYSRTLYVDRHNMRKLVGLGVISGLIK
jgi:ribosomal protein S14